MPVHEASDGIRISLLVAGLPRLFGEDLHHVIDLARDAEQAGIDQFVLPDHLAIGPRTDRYPYGRWPGPDEAPWLEPLTTLAAISSVTDRIRLGTGVLIAPLRQALTLAKTAATLDVLSRGRLDLGVGTGWQREEFAAAGVPFTGRTARMDDTLRACRALWSDSPASFSSATVEFEDLLCLPRPIQAGGPPIWIGGGATEGNLARLAEYGAGWMPIGLDDTAFIDGVSRARAALEAAGRDPASLGVRATLAPVIGDGGRVDIDATLAGLPQLKALGATVASVALPAFVRNAGEAPAFLSRLARAAR